MKNQGTHITLQPIDLTVKIAEFPFDIRLRQILLNQGTSKSYKQLAQETSESVDDEENLCHSSIMLAKSSLLSFRLVLITVIQCYTNISILRLQRIQNQAANSHF